jgi:predicted aspartyl protease
MLDDMGIFRTTVEMAALDRPGLRRVLVDVMVDTGSEYSWAPEALLAELGIVPVRVDRFETANGEILERPVGFALIYVAGRVAPGVVAFAQPGDMVLLGAQSLEGLNLRVDLTRRELVPGGPLPAAAIAGIGA